ncbi:hypothetical protein [Mycobacterium sp.]|uniref:hypothetical protein n=1 Tax=Mycobacterium sp. TaxID=1785 RepID=UPI003A8A3F75
MNKDKIQLTNELSLYLDSVIEIKKRIYSDLCIRYKDACRDKNLAQITRLGIQKNHTKESMKKYESLKGLLSYVLRYGVEEKFEDVKKNIKFLEREISYLKEQMDIFFHDIPEQKKQSEEAIENFESILEILNTDKYS